MGTTADLENEYKRLKEINNANLQENLKMQGKRDENINRIKKMIQESNIDLDLEVDFDKLQNMDYIQDLKRKLEEKIDTLSIEFEENINRAKKELGEI